MRDSRDYGSYFINEVVPLIRGRYLSMKIKDLNAKPRGKGSVDSKRNNRSIYFIIDYETVGKYGKNTIPFEFFVGEGYNIHNDGEYYVLCKSPYVSGSHEGHGNLSNNPAQDADNILQDFYDILYDMINYYEDSNKYKQKSSRRNYYDFNSAKEKKEDKGFSKAKPGEGKRFEECVKKMKGKKGVYDPEGLCAWMGRKKYGKGKMKEWAKEGKSKYMSAKFNDAISEVDSLRASALEAVYSVYESYMNLRGVVSQAKEIISNEVIDKSNYPEIVDILRDMKMNTKEEIESSFDNKFFIYVDELISQLSNVESVPNSQDEVKDETSE